jgi:hypothetical protein
MPASFSKPATSKQAGNKRYVTPVIGFERPDKKSIKKDECVTFKLRSSRADENSLTYELTVPFFRSGTPEELLIFLKLVKRVIAGTNTTTGPNQYALIRRLLQGEALTAFNNAATRNGTETQEHFKACCEDLIRHVFPRKSLVMQKRWMRRFLRKPMEIKTREFIGRLTELNDYLSKFPENFNNDQKLPADEIMDIAEFGIPATWQRTMVLQGFDPVEHDPQAFVEFCERIEFAEGQNDHNKEKNSRSDSKSAKDEIARAKTSARGTKRKNPPEPQYYCHLHGQNSTHDSNHCKNLKQQAENMRKAYLTLPDFKKRFKSTNKTWTREKDQKEKKKEALMFQAMKEAAKEILSIEKEGNKNAEGENQLSKMDPPSFDELNAEDFKNLGISDDDNDDEEEDNE